MIYFQQFRTQNERVDYLRIVYILVLNQKLELQVVLQVWALGRHNSICVVE